MNKKKTEVISDWIDISEYSYSYKNTPWGHRHHVDGRKNIKLKQQL